MASWFSGLLTLSGLVCFMTGFISAYVINWIRCKIMHKKWNVNFRYAGIAVGIVIMLFLSLQTNLAYTTAKMTAQEVQDCQREFNHAITLGRQITTENDSLSVEERNLLVQYNHIQNDMWLKLVDPPEEIAKLDTSNLIRQDYGLKVVRSAMGQSGLIDKRILEIEANQRNLAAQRAAHPLPDPTCGK